MPSQHSHIPYNIYIYIYYIFLPSIFPQSTDTSPREGIIPRKLKRGNSKLLWLSQNHTNHKSREGLSSSSASYQLIYINDQQFSSLKQELSEHTVPPNITLYANQPISNNALGIKSLQHYSRVEIRPETVRPRTATIK